MFAATTALRNHLKNKHAKEYTSIFEEPSTSGIKKSTAQASHESVPGPSPKPKQLTLKETVDRKLLWDINDPRSKKYHYLIGEMIAIDNEPFSLVEQLVLQDLWKKQCRNIKCPVVLI